LLPDTLSEPGAGGVCALAPKSAGEAFETASGIFRRLAIVPGSRCAGLPISWFVNFCTADFGKQIVNALSAFLSLQAVAMVAPAADSEGTLI
jgi:hypothetical protein